MQLREKNGRFASRMFKKPQPKLTNHVAFVIDASGSMAGPKWRRVSELFNNLVSDLDPNQETFVDIYTFSDHVQNHGTNLPIKSGVQFPTSVYPSGYTALRQAVHAAISNFQVRTNDPNASFLIITLTDGEENGSHWCSEQMLQEKIRTVQGLGNWTLAFQVPPGATGYITKWGIPAGNVVEWENSVAGVEQTMRDTSNAMVNYTTARSAGLKSVQNFYSAVTDLSHVTQNDLNKLNDVSNRFKTVTVPGEIDIKSFVEAQTGNMYIPGTAFFQLTKPEKIQANKQILVMEKGGKKILGGQEARKLIGLQEYKDGKIVPGNHANYDIFVQSTSTNRKLVRGTKLAVLK